MFQYLPSSVYLPGPLLLVGLFTTGAIFASEQEVAKDRHLFADQIARRLADDISPTPGQNLQVGVLPFGDENQMASQVLGTLSLEMQGEIIRALRQVAGNGIQIPSQRSISALVQRPSTSVHDVRADPAGRKEFLDAVGLDYVIWGEFQVSSGRAALRSEQKWIGVRVYLASRLSTDTRTYDGRVDKGDFTEILPSVANPPFSPNPPESGIHQQDVAASQRFRVTVIDHQGDLLPMQFVSDPESEFHNSLYLNLDERHRDTPFKIRISDQGGPPIGIVNRNPDIDRRQRLHQVAVKVDGINSIWPQTENGYEPTTGHPYYQPKWVLTPPGMKLAWDTDAASTVKGAVLAPASNGQPDGSTITIEGFQAGASSAREFVFARHPRESLAVTRGLGTNDLGLITVYFFAQQFPQKEMVQNYFFNLYHRSSFHGITKSAPGSSQGSTRAGRELRSPTFTVRFDILRQPVQIWRIFYRYGDPLTEPSLRPLQLKSFATITR